MYTGEKLKHFVISIKEQSFITVISWTWSLTDLILDLLKLLQQESSA